MDYHRPMVNLSSPAHPAAARNTEPASAAAAPVNARHWTRAKMLRFIQMLAETCSVSIAAECTGMSRQSAYRLRARLVGQPFDLAWEAALEFGLQQLAHAALDRAINGVAMPVFYRGEQVGERRVFNERATLNLMLAAGHIGRNHYARDWATRNWTDLLERLGEGPIVWTDEEKAAADPDHPLNQEGGEITETPADPTAAEQAGQAKEEAQRFIENESNYRPDADGRQPRVRVL